MGSSRQEINRLEIKRHIKTEFLSLYAQGGIDHISIGSLCSACGIARSTFYYYYSDKYCVLEAIEDEMIGSLWDINTKFEWRIEDIRIGRPLEACIQTIQFITEHIETFKILLGPYGDPQFVYRWKRGLEQHFLKCFMAIRGADFTADIACTIFSSAAIGLFTKYVFGIKNLSPYSFAIILGNLLEHCLFDFHAVGL